MICLIYPTSSSDKGHISRDISQRPWIDATVRQSDVFTLYVLYILYTSESDHLICVADLIYLLDSPFTSFSTPPIAFSRNRPTSRASMRYLHARFMYIYLYLGTLVSFSSVKSTLKTDISFLFLTCTCQQKRVKKCLTFHPRIAYTALFYPLPLRFCQKSFKTCGIQRCFSKEISPETKHSGLITDLMSTLSDRH